MIPFLNAVINETNLATMIKDNLLESSADSFEVFDSTRTWDLTKSKQTNRLNLENDLILNVAQ